VLNIINLVLERIKLLSVENEFLWTSGIVSNCAEEFSWCSVNQKVDPEMATTVDGTKFLAVSLPLNTESAQVRSFNSSTKLYFACEVKYPNVEIFVN